MAVHDILTPLRAQKEIVFLPVCTFVEELKLKKRTTTIEALLTTSPDAYAKANPESRNTEYEKGDYRGPFDIAVAVSERLDDQGKKFTKLVVIGNAQYLDEQLISAYAGNRDFFLNALSWMYERKINLSVRPKSLISLRLHLTAFQSLLFSGIVVILIPLIVFGIGLTVWLRRRHL